MRYIFLLKNVKNRPALGGARPPCLLRLGASPTDLHPNPLPLRNPGYATAGTDVPGSILTEALLFHQDIR